jgi:hypothetical protein
MLPGHGSSLATGMDRPRLGRDACGMTSTFPWGDLPIALGELLRSGLSGVVEEVIATVRAEVPEYDQPLEGEFGTSISRGVTVALEQFVGLLAATRMCRISRRPLGWVVPSIGPGVRLTRCSPRIELARGWRGERWRRRARLRGSSRPRCTGLPRRSSPTSIASRRRRLLGSRRPRRCTPARYRRDATRCLSCSRARRCLIVRRSLAGRRQRGCRSLLRRSRRSL